MTIAIDTINRLLINNIQTGLALAQTREGTIIFRPENKATGQKYQEIAMPYNRYSTAHDYPHKVGEVYDPSKSAGAMQLEKDLLVFLAA